jgi:hypothetical protein
MSTKSRQTIYGGAIMGAEIRARSARETAKKAARVGLFVGLLRSADLENAAISAR